MWWWLGRSLVGKQHKKTTSSAQLGHSTGALCPCRATTHTHTAVCKKDKPKDVGSKKEGKKREREKKNNMQVIKVRHAAPRWLYFFFFGHNYKSYRRKVVSVSKCEEKQQPTNKKRLK